MPVPYPDPHSRSAALHQRASRVLADGASRTTVAMRPYPVSVRSGEGAWVTDVDGHRYLDLNGNYTSLVLGHAHPAVTAAVTAQVRRGTAFALATEAEVALAERLCARVPSIERVRFTGSGSEAVMTAIKAARAYTGRPMIAKVEGAYHGGYDHAETSLGVGPDQWGDPSAPTPVPYAAGAPASVAAEVAILPFNDPEVARSVIGRCGTRLAAVLIDTLPNRVGLPSPEPAFLEAVWSAAHEVGALVIQDEVITYRLGPAGHQGRLGTTPDLTALGKVIGGGFPVGAVGGRAEVMAVFEPLDGSRPRVPSGGTFTANPVTMVAGAACLDQLDGEAYRRLDLQGERAREGLRAVFAQAGLGWQVTGEGSLLRIHPHDRPVRGYRDAAPRGDEAAVMAALQVELLRRQVIVTSYGTACTNLAVTPADLDHLVDAVAGAVVALAG